MKIAALSSRQAAGFTTLEMLASLALFAVVTALSVPSLKSAAMLYKTVCRQDTAANEIRSVIEQLTAASMRSRTFDALESLFVLDSSTKPLPPAVNAELARRPPAPGSAVVTFLELRSDSKFFAEQRLNGDSYLVCHQPADGTARYWLGVTLDGVHIVAGTLSRAALRTSYCRAEQSVLDVGKSRLTQLLAEPASELAADLAFYPVEDICSYYLTLDGSMRRYSWITGENQPMARGIKYFRLIAENSSALGRFYRLALAKDGETEAAQEFSISAPATAPGSIANLVL